MMQIFYKDFVYFNPYPTNLKLACIVENYVLKLLGKVLCNDICKFGFNWNAMFSHVLNTKTFAIPFCKM